MRTVVLDSWACIAFLKGEPEGAEVHGLVEEAKEGALSLCLCLVNLGEVLYRVQRTDGAAVAEDVLEALEALPVEFVPVDLELTRRAASLKAVTPVAYADCFAAALAQLRDAEVATGDPEFRKFGSAIKVLWLSAE